MEIKGGKRGKGVSRKFYDKNIRKKVCGEVGLVYWDVGDVSPWTLTGKKLTSLSLRDKFFQIWY
jgi:hypothetical protein